MKHEIDYFQKSRHIKHFHSDGYAEKRKKNYCNDPNSDEIHAFNYIIILKLK